jgi:hypothetical protein
MSVFAAFILGMSIISGLIGKVLDSETILMGAGVNALAGIGFAILSLRDA